MKSILLFTLAVVGCGGVEGEEGLAESELAGESFIYALAPDGNNCALPSQLRVSGGGAWQTPRVCYKDGGYRGTLNFRGFSTYQNVTIYTDGAWIPRGTLLQVLDGGTKVCDGEVSYSRAVCRFRVSGFGPVAGPPDDPT